MDAQAGMAHSGVREMAANQNLAQNPANPNLEGKPLLRISQAHVYEMITHAQADDPNECCGILGGADDSVTRLYRITNTAHSPYRYLMAPQEQLNAMLDCDRNGWDVLAFYHSHTHSAAYPSPTDVRMAQESGWIGEHVIYVLVSLEDKANPLVRMFNIAEDGTITETEFEVMATDTGDW